MKRLIAGVLLVLAVTGCAGATPTQNPSATEPPLAQLSVGDCTAGLDSGKTLSVPTVDCAKPHNWEVAGLVPLDEQSYPGPDVLRTTASQKCPTIFRDYVGVNTAASPYTLTYLAPSEIHWSDPENRTVVCLAGSTDVKITDSLKDTNLVFPQVGECTQQPPAGGVGVKLTSCDTEHYYEVYAAKEWTGKKAPTDKQLAQLYRDVCVKGFTKFVGVDSGKSKYEILRFQAPSASWSSVPDHRTVCAAGSPSGGITGTLKGAKK
jgi:Septum formation